MYNNSQSELNQKLVRIAHSLINSLSSEGEEILKIAHQLQDNTLVGNVPSNDLLRSLQLLLEDNGIQFAVIGGLAVMVHGSPRSTSDINVLVDCLLPSDRVKDSVYMERFGFYKKSNPSSTGIVMTIDHRRSGYAECLLANDELERWAIGTAKVQSLLGAIIPVVSPEALVALKVRAWMSSQGKRMNDPGDIISVLTRNRDINIEEIKVHLNTAEIEYFTKLVLMI